MSEKWEDRIHESIEEWEPPAGAKERMLANIRRKAAEQNAMRADEPASRAKVLSINPMLKWLMPLAAWALTLL